jgi:hypothetical protein
MNGAKENEALLPGLTLAFQMEQILACNDQGRILKIIRDLSLPDDISFSPGMSII